MGANDRFIPSGYTDGPNGGPPEEYRGDIMNIVEMAINKNEMKFLLEGKNGYKLD